MIRNLLIITIITVEGLVDCDYRLANRRYRTGLRGRSSNQNSVKSRMEEYGIVPDVIDVAPTTIIQV